MLGKRKGLGRVGDHIVHASWRGTRWWSSWQRTLVNRRALLLSWCALLFSFVPGIPSVLRQTAGPRPSPCPITAEESKIRQVLVLGLHDHKPIKLPLREECQSIDEPSPCAAAQWDCIQMLTPR
ncbi:hypothetical protein AB1N83_009224 [Pleurotus pulmonarius]